MFSKTVVIPNPNKPSGAGLALLSRITIELSWLEIIVSCFGGDTAERRIKNKYNSLSENFFYLLKFFCSKRNIIKRCDVCIELFYRTHSYQNR